MILNSQRHPKFSLYYLGGVLLKMLEDKKVVSMWEMFNEVQKTLGEDVYIDFIIYSLDWLYLLDLIKVEEGKVYYEN